MENEEEYYLRQLEKHADHSRKTKTDSVKRFDILMTSLSVLGLGFVTNYIKDVELSIDLIFAHFAQITFVVCVFLNLLSHVFSIWTNSHCENLAKEEYYWYKETKMTNEDDDTGEIETKNVNFHQLEGKLTFLMKSYNLTIRVLNILSFVALILGILFFTIFLAN